MFYKFEKSLLNLAFSSHPRNIPYHLQPFVLCEVQIPAPCSALTNARNVPAGGHSVPSTGAGGSLKTRTRENHHGCSCSFLGRAIYAGYTGR